jgi:hypothetical protein
MKFTACSCIKDTVFPDGGKPDFFKDEEQAAEAVRAHQAMSLHQETYQVPGEPWSRRRYWGVHVNGRHVLSL